MATVVPVRMDESEKSLISECSRKLFGMSMSSFLRESAIERIEEELDVEAYKTALEAYRANPESHTLDEVEGMLGL